MVLCERVTAYRPDPLTQTLEAPPTQLDREDIARWLEELAAGGYYARRSIRIFRMVLRAALEDAVASGAIRRNPAARVGMPRQVAKPDLQREAQTWTEDEVRRFVAAIDDHRWAAPIRLCVLYGLRRSELLGLRWSCVDLKRRAIRIERGLVEVHGRPEWSDGKNARSRRTIAIDESTVRSLAAHRKFQAEERLLAGSGWVDNDLVVATRTGTPVSSGNFDQTLERLIGVPADLWWRWRRRVTYVHDAHPMPFGIIRESVSDAIRCRRSVAVARGRPPLDRHELKSAVDSADVVRVRGDDTQLALSAGERYGRINDVGGAADSAELSDGAGGAVVKGDDLAQRRAEEPGQSHLSTPVAPGLSDDPSGHDEGITMIKGARDDGHHSTIVALEVDKRSGVEHGSAHRPRARSAALRSRAVSGPPVSASISSSNEARSSSFAFSSKAAAT